MQKQKVKGKGLWTALSILFSLLFIISMVGGPIANNYAQIINMVLGTESSKTIGDPGKEYFTADYTSEQQVVEGQNAVENVVKT